MITKNMPNADEITSAHMVEMAYLPGQHCLSAEHR